MSETHPQPHIAPPEKLWLFEQANDEWMTWSGTEDDLKEFLKGSGIKAYEFSLTDRVLTNT